MATRFNLFGFVSARFFLPILGLAAFFIGSVAFIGPSGNFPLNDDWSFAIATRNLASAHTWMPTGWTSMPLISNALWGLPICAVSSCSFNDLRLSTLLASFLLMLTSFFLLRQINKRSFLPVVASLLVAFNPIGFALSFTFMTDILFSFLLSLSALLFIVTLEGNSATMLVAATLVALAATMSRQLGLCVPLAYFAVRMLQFGIWQKKSILALAPFVLCAASLALFDHWLKVTGKVPALYNAQSNAMLGHLALRVNHTALHFVDHLALHVLGLLVMILLYLGTFTLPLLLLTRRPAVKANTPLWMRRAPFVAAGGIALIAVIEIAAKQQIMPIGGNILVPQGIGPLTLRDTDILGLHSVPSLPTAFWLVVTISGLLGMFELTVRAATYVVVTVAENARAKRWPWAFGPGEAGTLFALVTIVANCLPLILAGAMFDRYLVPIIPVTLFFLASISRSGPVGGYRIFASATLCLLITIFSVMAEHDYMAWNRTRWTAIADLQAAGMANPSTLDGGFEYNGLFNYNPLYSKSDTKSWWWIDKDNYQISFGPVAGMEIIKKYDYENFLPPARRQIFVLRKDAGLEGPAAAPLPAGISQ